MPKFLFITHEASRTGAPIVLLEYLKWIRANRDRWQIFVLSLNTGPLSEEFRSFAHEFYEHPGKMSKSYSRKLPVINKSIKRKNKVFGALANEGFDIIYANTVVSIPVACDLNYLNSARVIAHIHEMETVINLLLPNFADYISDITAFITPSNIARNQLTKNYKIKADDVTVLNEFVKPAVPSNYVREKDYILIGGCGTVHWRKGSDLFIQIAAFIKNQYPNLKIIFRWAGAMSRQEELIANSDIKKAGLEETVFFIGEKSDLNLFLNSLDIFLLTSREDPFPLVAIEAAQRGKPIICFDKATGTAEKLKDGGGKVVPYLDVKSMAEAILFYVENTEELLRDGNTAKQNFAQLIPEVMGEKYSIFLENILN